MTTTIPPYYEFEDLEAWLRAHPLTLPDDWAEREARIRARLSASIAALDALGACAGYARMTLKAWKAGQHG